MQDACRPSNNSLMPWIVPPGQADPADVRNGRVTCLPHDSRENGE